MNKKVEISLLFFSLVTDLSGEHLLTQPVFPVYTFRSPVTDLLVWSTEEA